MGGLTRLFVRILPIITLICFICFGMSYTFETQQTGSITYLSKEVITLNDNNTPTTADDITIEQYRFDMVSYANNIDIDILQRATSNVIDFEGYQNTVNTFNLIWEDGYQFFDGIHTIINAVILVINSIITIINCIITPLRLIAGIMLTGMSLLGININTDTPLISINQWILDSMAIPLIRPTYNKESGEYLLNTKWQQNNWIQIIQNDDQGIIHYYDITFNFSSDAGGHYKRLICAEENGLDTLRYIDTNDNSIVVWQNGTWIYQDSKTITIDNNNPSFEVTQNVYWLIQYLAENANQII